MDVDWFAVRSRPIRAVEHGVLAVDDHFKATYTGPRSSDRLDYPAAEVLPNSTERADPTNWVHSVYVNLYFERGTGYDYIEDVLHPTADVLDACLAELSEVDCITDYHPASIQDFAGELDNTSVLLVSIEFRARSLVDSAEF